MIRSMAKAAGRPPGAPARRAARSGAVALVLVLVLLLILCTLQWARRLLMGQVGDQVTREVLGQIAETIAESAIAEATSGLATRVNDPAGALGRRLRAHAGRSGAPDHGVDRFTLGDGAIDRTVALARKEYNRRFEVSPVEARLEVLGPPVPGVPSEYDASLALSVRVRSTAAPRVERILTVTRGLRLLTPGLPAPLGRSLVTIVSPYHLLAGSGQHPYTPESSAPAPGVRVNDLLDEVKSEVPLFVARHRELFSRIEELERKLSDAGPGAAAALAFVRNLEALYGRVAGDGGVDLLARMQELAARARRFPDRPDRFLLASKAPVLDLSRLDLQARFVPAAREWQSVRESSRPAWQIADRDLKDERIDRTALEHHRHFSDLVLEHARLMVRVLGDVTDFHEDFDVLERSAPPVDSLDWSSLTRAHRLVEPFQLSGPSSLVHARATYALEEDPPGPGRVPIDRKLTDLLARLDPTADGLVGTIIVANDHEELHLTGTIRGHLTIAVKGGLSVEDLRGDATADLITVIARGGAGRPVKVAGEVHARLVTTGRELVVAPGTRMHGNLILWDVGMDSTGHLAGTIERRDATAAGAREVVSHVVLSPWVRSVEPARR
jgi:hypothetical protein